MFIYIDISNSREITIRIINKPTANIEILPIEINKSFALVLNYYKTIIYKQQL